MAGAEKCWFEGAMRTLLLMASLVAPTIAMADTSYFWLEEQTLANHFNDGVMHLNGREFLMGDLHVWPKASDDFSVSFMVRSSVWLRGILDDDAVLKYQDFDIRRTQDSSHTGIQYFDRQMALAPSPPQNSATFYYKPTLDPPLQVGGYNTYSNGSAGLYFLTKNSEVKHGFQCSQDLREGLQIGEFRICNVVVVYPYATNLVLNGSRIRSGTVAEYGANFAAIAERMIEVVTFIDITDNENSDRPTDLSQLLKNNPNLTDCKSI